MSDRAIGWDVWDLGETIKFLAKHSDAELRSELADLIQHREALIDLVERVKQARAA